jgi:NAD+ kinase
MDHIGTVGLVLHPRRSPKQAVDAIVEWAVARSVTVLGLPEEIDRIDCHAQPADAERLVAESDLVVSLGGDGTMLRAMRLTADTGTPLLGVNLGKLGFLAEIDVGDLPDALTAVYDGGYKVESRMAIATSLPDGLHQTAFNDIALVRIPGHPLAAIAISVNGEQFVNYAADAIIAATTTGSTAYSYSAGGPIVSPKLEAFLVVPAAAHSSFNRALVLPPDESARLEVLPGSGQVAVEVDGLVRGQMAPGDSVVITAVPNAACVVRLGNTTFYQRARRKLNVLGSAEIS